MKSHPTLHDKHQKSHKIKTVDPDVKRLQIKADHLLRVGPTQFIYKFDPRVLNTEKEGKRIGIIGMTGSGKSLLILELMRFARRIPAWMILNPSEPGNQMYSSYCENEGIIHDRENIAELVKDLQALKTRQIKRCKDWLIPGSNPKKYYRDPSAAVIMDDITSDLKIFNDPIFGWIFNLSRNFKLWVAFLIQYIIHIPRKFRRQLSHVFLFDMTLTDQKTAYNEFASTVFPTFEDFRQAFMKSTDGKGKTLVIDVSKQTHIIHEKVFWYHHQVQQPKFKVGSDWFNEQVRERYNPSWEQSNNLVQEITKTGLFKKEPLNIQLV